MAVVQQADGRVGMGGLQVSNPASSRIAKASMRMNASSSTARAKEGVGELEMAMTGVEVGVIKLVNFILDIGRAARQKPSVVESRACST